MTLDCCRRLQNFEPNRRSMFSRGFYLRLHKKVFQVSIIVDVFVFAREGAVKGNCELKKI